MSSFQEKEYDTSSLNLKLWKQIFSLLHDRKIFVVTTLFLLMSAVGEAAFPIFYKFAIDSFASAQVSLEHLPQFVILVAINIIFVCIACYMFFYMAGKIEMNFSYIIRKNCFDKLQQLSFSYYDITPSGWIVARVSNDVARLAEIVSWAFVDIIYGLISIVFIMIIMLMVNVKLAMIIIILMPILFGLTYYLQNKVLFHSRKVRSINSKIVHGFNEGITGAKTTKTLCLEDDNYANFTHDTRKMYESSVKRGMVASLFNPLIFGFSGLASSLLLYFGGHMVLVKSLEFGTLLMFVQYVTTLFTTLRPIAADICDLQMAQASGERVISLLDTPLKIADKAEVVAKYGTKLAPKVENYETVDGDVEFSHVDFAYIDDQYVLKDFNLTVKHGEMIALVGETGSGKSTIINLLCRFYEPTNGSIKIDGIDYRERSLGWLHSNIGYVLQAPHLFSGSIADNIRYGKLDATLEQVKEVCHLIKADEFIEALPDKYDSQVGEGGNLLSTGQKQMLSFARALIKKPKIFVLDEATSSIDTQTEKIIQYAIDHVMKDHTTFVVAHRLSTIVNADKILVIKNGKIQEMGRHEELMAKKGYYHHLYMNQFKEESVDELLDDITIN
ncbi:MAG: ABC transporter ATP-binding protein [Erysipelotrichaceae bacterium]|nr:ABC transporter ATP-binding protein [Erysipelotrichaceae bacterium]